MFCFVAGILQLLVWHFAISYGGIIGFSITYGMFGTVTSSLVAVVIGQLFDVQGKLASVVGVAMLLVAPGKLLHG